jgi:hypothetical protein
MDSNFSTSIDYDAAVDWYTESYEAYTAAFSDPYYVKFIEPDEHNFIDKGQLDESNTGKKTVVRAVGTLGICRNMIKDGRPCIEVSNEIWQKFRESKSKDSD